MIDATAEVEKMKEKHQAIQMVELIALQVRVLIHEITSEQDISQTVAKIKEHLFSLERMHERVA